jgi:hypothetical protein
LNLRRRGDHPLGHVPHLMEGHLREPLARPRDDVLDVLDGVTPDVGDVVCGDLKIVDAVVVIRQDCAVACADDVLQLTQSLAAEELWASLSCLRLSSAGRSAV